MNNQLRNTVPLVKAVKAAIIDTHEDINKTQETFTHWACRGLKKLQREVLRRNKQYVLLPVNGNFNTAPLPADLEEEIFVGYINEFGEKIRFRPSSELSPYESIAIDKGCNPCPKCKQDKNICNDLQVTQEVNIIQINGVNYEESITKKLYPNGDYYLEKTTPVLNTVTGVVDFIPQKIFINNFDLKDCGCLEDTSSNLSTLQTTCPDVYANYYGNCCEGYLDGSYRIFEEKGIIQLDTSIDIDWLYVEYWGYMLKINGQYHVPEVAFETIVEFTKYKSIQNKKNVPASMIQMWFQSYMRERGNMEKILGRVSLARIMQQILSIPKFDLDMNRGWYDTFQKNRAIAAAKCSSSKTVTSSSAAPTQVIETVVQTIEVTKEIAYGKLQFEIGQPSSPMVVDDTILTINEAGIKENSVNVLLNSVPLEEDIDDQASYHVDYGPNAIAITFLNHPAEDGDRYKITYTKEINS